MANEQSVLRKTPNHLVVLHSLLPHAQCPFSSGVVDQSEFEYQPMDFHAEVSFPSLAKWILVAVLLRYYYLAVCRLQIAERRL